MSLAAGDRGFIIPAGSGKDTTVKLETVAAGDRCVIMTNASGKPVVVKLNPVAAGDRILVVPDRSGKSIPIRVAGGSAVMMEWVLMTDNFNVRSNHAAIVQSDNRVIFMGGSESSGYLGNKHDVNYSDTKGATWGALGVAAWSARLFPTAVILSNGHIILMGGFDFNLLNDVWKSVNGGATWTQQTASAGWSPRFMHRSVVTSDNTIVVMGGITNTASGICSNEVWYSTDEGVTWYQCASPGWSARGGHQVSVLSTGEIVLTGGCDYTTAPRTCNNEVWLSDDKGASWQCQSGGAEWHVRERHLSVARHDGSIFVLGGYYYPGYYHNDVWKSVDKGITWVQPPETVSWPGRMDSAAVCLSNNEIIVMGGWGNIWNLRDCWRYKRVGDI